MYDTAILIITIVTVLLSSIQVFVNNSLADRSRNFFLISSALLLFVSVAEWLCGFLPAHGQSNPLLLGILKAIEYSAGPAVAFLWVRGFREYRNAPLVLDLLVVHAVIQFLSIHFGWVFYFDAEGIYHHGPFYFLYVLSYLAALSFLVIEILRLGRRYQDKNILTLIVLLLFVGGGMLAQVFLDGIHVFWLCVSISYFFFYHYFTDQLADIDRMTDLLNRNCFEKSLQRIHYMTAIIMFDVDDFKHVNDSFGHPFGDVCLRTVAGVIRKTYSRVGYCYRVGGDEFCVILKRSRLKEMPEGSYEISFPGGEKYTVTSSPEFLQKVNRRFNDNLIAMRQQMALLPDVSLGYEFWDGKEDAEDVVRRADDFLYRHKRLRKLRALEQQGEFSEEA